MGKLEPTITVSVLPPSAGAFRYVATLDVREWRPAGEGRRILFGRYHGRTKADAVGSAEEGFKGLERMRGR